MKKLLPFLLTFLLLGSLLAVPALATVDLSNPAYVVDDANVLSPTVEDSIIQMNQHLESNCLGAQFVVVTTLYAPQGMDQEEYAVEIFDTWHLGSAEENNGMLLVLYTGNGEYWLECGSGIYNSPYVDEIADMVADNGSFNKAVVRGDYEKAVSTLAGDLTGWFESYYGGYTTGNSGYSSSSGSNYTSGGTSYSSGETMSDGEAILILLLLIVLTSPFRVRRRWGHWGFWPFVYFSSWWPTRQRRPRGLFSPGYRSGPGYYNPGSTWHSTPTSWGDSRPPHNSWGSSSHSSGSWSGSSHSSGSSWSSRSSGGHSGGGFGSRGSGSSSSFRSSSGSSSFRSSGGSSRSSGGGSFRSSGGGRSGGGFGKR